MKIGEYLKETKTEMHHVSWPTKAQAISFTIVVILISVGTSLYLGLFDWIFSQILQKFI
jgi:preprotein translocase subunit SecE